MIPYVTYHDLFSCYGSSRKGAANCFDPRTTFHHLGVEGYDPQRSQVLSSPAADIPGPGDELADIVSLLHAIWYRSHGLWHFHVHTALGVSHNTHDPKAVGIQAVGRGVSVFLALTLLNVQKSTFIIYRAVSSLVLHRPIQGHHQRNRAVYLLGGFFFVDL